MIRKKPGAKGPAAGAAARPAGGSTDATLTRVRELAQIATEFDLAEIELEPAGRIRLSRRMSGGGGGQPAYAPAPPAAPAAPVPAPTEASEAGDAVFVASPFVGTFYRSPSPDAASFVEVGQTVRKGQVVCIIEAMKLMNEIESEAEGKVVEVLAKNGEHVEYGQKLFRLSPT
jgi:acetyl-CoA carboxylase biotin carboxyl carrier protein